MTYDLRRLRLHGLIQRVPRTFHYIVTHDGLRLAFGLSRIYLRLLQPNWAALHLPTPEVPEPLRAALYHLDLALHQLLAEAADSVPTAA